MPSHSTLIRKSFMLSEESNEDLAQWADQVASGSPPFSKRIHSRYLGRQRCQPRPTALLKHLGRTHWLKRKKMKKKTNPNCPCSKNLELSKMTEVLKFVSDDKDPKKMNAVFCQASKHISQCDHKSTGVCVLKIISSYEEFYQTKRNNSP